MARSVRETIPPKKSRVYNGVKVTNLEDRPINVRVEATQYLMRDPHPPELDSDEPAKVE